MMYFIPVFFIAPQLVALTVQGFSNPPTYPLGTPEPGPHGLGRATRGILPFPSGQDSGP